jgi:hypothetical protein
MAEKQRQEEKKLGRERNKRNENKQMEEWEKETTGNAREGKHG